MIYLYLIFDLPTTREKISICSRKRTKSEISNSMPPMFATASTGSNANCCCRLRKSSASITHMHYIGVKKLKKNEKKS